MNPYSRAATILKKSLIQEKQSSKLSKDLFANLDETLGPLGPVAVNIPRLSCQGTNDATLCDISRTRPEKDVDSDKSSIKNPFLTSESESDSDNDEVNGAIMEDMETITPEVQPEEAETNFDSNNEITPPTTEIPMEQDQAPNSLGSEGPSKERKSRKRQRHLEDWKQNIRKRKRNNGEEYTSKAGKKIGARKRKLHKCGACKHKCNEKINEEAREKLFHEYWNLGDYTRQRDFISYNVKRKSMKKQCLGSRKSTTLIYFLPLEQEQVQVCKQTFLSTLGIGEKTVYHTLDHRNENGMLKGDRRGGKNSKNTTPDKVLDDIRDHINSFPAVESHYCRSSSEKKYLGSNLNLVKMYNLYVQHCIETGKTAAKMCIYRKVFNLEFNIGFHKPKKDVCNHCFLYDHSSEERKAELREDHLEHQRRKEEAREKKETDKRAAFHDTSTKVCTFDLQAVLQSPKSNVSSVYYKRKLNSYNFTIFDLVTKECNCYMWHEAAAKRGSNEIASCLSDYLIKQPEKKFKMYSDACGGQNRNRNMCAMLHHIVQTTHIQTIEHTYMESGHSQMEVDSVHATIERVARNVTIDAPSQYETIVQVARTSNPYIVHAVDTNFFRDFSSPNSMRKSTDGNTVKWMKIKRFIYTKEKIEYSYEYSGAMFEIATENPRRSTRNMHGCEVPLLYKDPPGISEAKYRDLSSLCKSGIIAKAYHSFYAELPYTTHQENED